VVAFASAGFAFTAFSSSVEGLSATGLDGGFLELTTLPSSGFGGLSVFLFLLGGGFLELTALAGFSDLPWFALSESSSVSAFD